MSFYLRQVLLNLNRENLHRELQSSQKATTRLDRALRESKLERIFLFSSHLDRPRPELITVIWFWLELVKLSIQREYLLFPDFTSPSLLENWCNWTDHRHSVWVDFFFFILKSKLVHWVDRVFSSKNVQLSFPCNIVAGYILCVRLRNVPEGRLKALLAVG